MPDKKHMAENIPYMSRVDAALNRQPRFGPVTLTLLTAFFFALFLAWAAMAEVDEVARGQGQVIPSQRTQIIQNLEGGILQSVLVQEGDVVEKNTLLARIDNVGAESFLKETQGKMLEHNLALLRLEATRNNTELVFPEEMYVQCPQLVADQLALYHSQREQHASELQMLGAQYQQRVQDVQEQKNRKDQLERSLKLSAEQRDIAKPLMERKIYSRVDFLGLEQKVIALQSDIQTLESTIPKAVAAADEAMQKLTLRQAELIANISEEINKRRVELASLQESLSAGGDKVTRMEVRSPVRGTVKQVMLNTEGGVVRPGEPIMEVVPLDDTLLVEARIRPADIAFIRPNQSAMVKISAYDFSIYGGLPAVVEQISADTIEDKRGEMFYLVKLRTNTNAITYHNEELPIMPGMVATVDILTGKKTILDYLLKPILKARQNALHER